MGAVTWGQWPTPRFPSPLVKPGVPISGTRLSDWALSARWMDAKNLGGQT
jgi:hypothetical protein